MDLSPKMGAQNWQVLELGHPYPLLGAVTPLLASFANFSGVMFGSSSITGALSSDSDWRTLQQGYTHEIYRFCLKFQLATQGPSWGYLKGNFSETLSIFGDKRPRNGSKNGEMAPRTGTGYPHIGVCVESCSPVRGVPGKLI